MLARLARRLSRERGWGAHLAALEWRQSASRSGELAGLRQAAGLSTAGGDSVLGSGAQGKRRGGRSSKGKSGPRGKPAAAPAESEGAQPLVRPPQPASPQQLDLLLGRFKVRTVRTQWSSSQQFLHTHCCQKISSTSAP